MCTFLLKIQELSEEERFLLLILRKVGLQLFFSPSSPLDESSILYTRNARDEPLCYFKTNEVKLNYLHSGTEARTVPLLGAA